MGGQVAGVEVSTDGGTTWHPATGRGTWSYVWATPTIGAVTVRVRAVDDSGNLPEHTVDRVVHGGWRRLPVLALAGLVTPPAASTRTRARSSSARASARARAGSVTALRFYKHSQNTGTHVGSLWSSTGTLLAQVTFTGETASGWQVQALGTSVALTPNTDYVVSYHTSSGFYTGDDGYFAASGVSSGPLLAPTRWFGWRQRPVQVQRPAARSRPIPTTARTTGSDVVFNTSGGSSDTTAPVVTITTPTSATTTTVTTTPFAFGGTASDAVGVTQVTWANNRGGSGTATGTTSWSVSGVVLQSGANVLTVTARDAAGNTSTDQLTVTYNVPDTIAPVVTITSPTSASSTTVQLASLNLGGTSSDAVGVTQVTWANDRGGSGTATGTTSWTANGIALLSGVNVITVSSRDAAGNVGTDSISVTYNPDIVSPVVTITGPTSATTFTFTASTLDVVGHRFRRRWA